MVQNVENVPFSVDCRGNLHSTATGRFVSVSMVEDSLAALLAMVSEIERVLNDRTEILERQREEHVQRNQRNQRNQRDVQRQRNHHDQHDQHNHQEQRITVSVAIATRPRRAAHHNNHDHDHDEQRITLSVPTSSTSCRSDRSDEDDGWIAA